VLLVENLIFYGKFSILFNFRDIHTGFVQKVVNEIKFLATFASSSRQHTVHADNMKRRRRWGFYRDTKRHLLLNRTRAKEQK
jgi:hypothetical protein